MHNAHLPLSLPLLALFCFMFLLGAELVFRHFFSDQNLIWRTFPMEILSFAGMLGGGGVVVVLLLGSAGTCWSMSVLCLEVCEPSVCSVRLA